MKKLLTVTALLLSSYLLTAQNNLVESNSNEPSKIIVPDSNPWVSNLNGIYYTGSIATKSNSEKVIELNNVGIGTYQPSYKLEVIGDIYANGGWLRASGSKGLYFQSYGGGFYMTDATWIRTYNNKSFYHNSGIMRTDGTFQVGSSGNRFIVNTSGNVGIATIAPTEKLQVEGNIKLLNDCGYIKKVKGLYFGWASGYGTQFNHGIFSTDGSTYSDDITLNSYGNVRINFDSNTNGGIEKFSIGKNTTGLVNTLFTVNESGNVGIGISTPTKKLDVSGDINYTGNLYKNGALVSIGGSSVWTQSGSTVYYNVTDKKVGIGTSNPSASLEVRHGVLKLSGHMSEGQFLNTNYARLTIDTEISEQHAFISCMNELGVQFYVHADGTVKCKKLMTEEVVVDNITLPDYVFDNSYNLRSIDEVEQFIKSNNHLPDVPTAKQVAEEGMNLKDMNNILLQKVEELTLYIIRMENRISELENK